MADASIQKVGYVGLGIMGAAMANNLLKAGYKLIVWNRTIAKAQPLADAGATVADSPADVAARGSQVVFVNVTDTQDVEQVIFGDHGIAAACAKGTVIIDNSTIHPAVTVDIARRLCDRGIDFLDAPVSGGDVGARNGTLSIMVGGEQTIFTRVQHLFYAIGRSITYLGSAGSGQTCKACNQIAVSINLLGVCEALAMAKANGLDLGKMIHVLAGGAAGSWQLDNLGPKITAGDLDPGFMIDYILKDLKIIGDTARSCDLPLHGAALVENHFREVAAGGGGRLGTQALCQTLEKLGDFRFVQ